MKIIQSKRLYFIKCFCYAFITACLVVAIDIVCGHIAPRSFINAQGAYWKDLVAVSIINWSLTFLILTCVFVLNCGLGRYIAGLFLFFAGIVYGISWATFMVVGEFVGVEGLRFAVYNFQDIVWLMRQISWVYMLILGLLLLSPCVFLFYLSQIKQRMQGIFIELENRKNVIFLVLCVCWVVIFIWVMALGIQTPRKHKFNLRFRVSPQASLFFDRAFDKIPKQYFESQSPLNVNWPHRIGWEQYTKSKTQHVRNMPIILIVIESLRADILFDNTVMPNVFALKQEGSSLQAYSSSNQSDYAWPSLLASQYPMRSRFHYYYPSRIPFPRVLIYDVLKHAGYSTGLFSAQNERWGGMYNFLNTGTLDILFSSDSVKHVQYNPSDDPGFAMFMKKFQSVGKIDDAVIIDAANKWIRDLASSKFFVTINLQRSHFPYTWPKSFVPPFTFCEPQPWLYAKNKTGGMKNRYFNALHYSDAQIGRLIGTLKEMGIYDQTTIVIMGDHGESFYEHNTPVHSNELFNETILTEVVIKLPQGKSFMKPIKIPELMDVAPTLNDLVGLPVHPAFQGRSWLTHVPVNKPVFISNNSPISTQDAIIDGDWKLIKDYRYNTTYLFNLRIDPQEKTNLYKYHSDVTSSLLSKLLYWRYKQLEYYQTLELTNQYYAPTFTSP